MSKGPGRVARIIVAALEAAPNNAFTTQELCERCYTPPILKKHRVAVLRTLRQIMARRPELGTLISEGLGGQVVAYWRCDVTSYAMARLKADHFNRYGSNDLRVHEHMIKTERQLRASLKPGGAHHHYVQEGGANWDEAQLAIAECAGDHKRAKALQAKLAKRREAARKKWFGTPKQST